MMQPAPSVEDLMREQEKSLGTPPALRVGMTQLDPNGIVLFHYTNQTTSLFLPEISVVSEG